MTCMNTTLKFDDNFKGALCRDALLKMGYDFADFDISDNGKKVTILKPINDMMMQFIINHIRMNFS